MGEDDNEYGFGNKIIRYFMYHDLTCAETDISDIYISTTMKLLLVHILNNLTMDFYASLTLG